MTIPVPGRIVAERALADAAGALAGLRRGVGPVKSQVVSFDHSAPFLRTTVTAINSPGAMALSHPLETFVCVDRPASLIRSRCARPVVEHQDQVLFRLNLRRMRQAICTDEV